jgi:hypothetical protein
MDLRARFNCEVAQRKLAAALVTLDRIVRLGPALLKWVPRPLLELATAGVLRGEEKSGTGQYAPSVHGTPIRVGIQNLSRCPCAGSFSEEVADNSLTPS